MTTGARAMAVAQMLADAGLRANGRWKRGSVPESANGESANSWLHRMKEAGQVIDAAPDLAVQVIAGATSLGMALEELERPKAQERQGRRTDLEPQGKFSSGPERTGKVYDLVGEAVGMRGPTTRNAPPARAGRRGVAVA